MPTIDLYGGNQKRTFVQRAFGMCGQSTTEFELTPEEYSLGLQIANDTAATLGDEFGFNFPDYGTGSPEDESGVAAADGLGFTVMLAEQIAQNIGKQFRANGMQETAKSVLIAKYQVIPLRTLGRDTVRGQGSRISGRAPFYRVEISADETGQ